MQEDQDDVPSTDFLSVVPDFDDHETFPEEDMSQELPEVIPETPSVNKRGRASIPSWDEIVFGTKTED